MLLIDQRPNGAWWIDWIINWLIDLWLIDWLIEWLIDWWLTHLFLLLFVGGHSFGYNVLFNTVRETSDHGPINTWDRQPYLMTHQSINGSLSQPTLFPLPSEIHHNTLFNNYNSFYPIDHDDGSCYWVDHSNVQIYGAKKNYLGWYINQSINQSFNLSIQPCIRLFTCRSINQPIIHLNLLFIFLHVLLLIDWLIDLLV